MWRQFKLKVGNRPIDPKHVAEIEKVIVARGYREHEPIKVNEQLQIVDGQHRWQACMNLNVAPTWVIGPDEDIDVIADMATAAKKWTKADRIASKAALGNIAAQKILQLMDEFGVAVNTATLAVGVDSAVRAIDNMVITDDQIVNARVMLHEVNRIFGCVQNNAIRVPRIVGAYKTIRNAPGFSVERFRDRMQQYGREMFVCCSTARRQVENLVSIYNYRTATEHRLPIPADTHN